MTFDLEDFSPLTSTPSGKKGIYYPNLTEITITSNKEGDKLELPFELKFGMNFEQIQQQIGKPTIDRRNIPRYKFGGCSWEITLKENLENRYYNTELYLNVINPDEYVLKELVLRTKRWSEVLPLNYVLEGKSVYKDWSKPYKAARFVEWAIKRGFFVETAKNKEGVDKVRKGEITRVEFMQEYYRNMPAIYLDEFSPETQYFTIYYIGGRIGIGCDTDTKYLYETLGDKYNQETIEQIIDQRLKEFTPDNMFTNSKQLGK